MTPWRFVQHSTLGRLVAVVAVVVFGLPVVVEQVAVAQGSPVRVMAIGDSITADNHGYVSNVSGAWRNSLYQLLAAQGHSNVEFVGSQNLDMYAAVPVPAALQGHEGYGDWTTCDFFTDFPAWRTAFRTQTPTSTRQGQPASWDITTSLTTYNPDVVVIFIGTNNFNDLLFGDNSCGPTQSNFERLYDTVVNWPTSPRVVISTMDIQGSAANPSYLSVVNQINTITRNYVSAKSAAEKQVCLAELQGVYTEPLGKGLLFQDFYHPTQYGKDVIADAFFNPVVRAINSQCTPSTTPPTTIPGPATGERLYAAAAAPTGSVVLGTQYAIETGQRINFTCPGTINGIWWYRVSGETGSTTVSAWRNGTLAGRGTGSPTGNGWTYMPFAAPVSVTPGDSLVLSVHHKSGAYGSTVNGFTNRSVTAPSGCFHAPATTPAAPNGLYAYTNLNGGANLPTYPTLSYSGSEYFISPDFIVTGITTTTTTPTTPTTGARSQAPGASPRPTVIRGPAAGAGGGGLAGQPRG